jgi:diguanylate cyclase (GGDEF)-like protein
VRYFDFSVNEGLFGVTEGFIIADNYKMKKSIQERNLKNFYKSKTIDPLTSLHTYEHFNTIVEKISRYQRNKDTEVLLAIVVIDDFPEIRRKYGFESDKAIQKVATILKKKLRDSDIIAKYNSDSFIMLLRDVREDESSFMLEKLQLSLASLKINGRYTISCSIAGTRYRFKSEKNILSDLEKVENYLSNSMTTEVNSRTLY